MTIPEIEKLLSEISSGLTDLQKRIEVVAENLVELREQIGVPQPAREGTR